jgi:hypothetical protein
LARGKNGRKVVKVGSGKKARKGTERAPSSGPEEASPPSLSQVMKMPKFETLEIINVDEDVEELIEEGDW